MLGPLGLHLDLFPACIDSSCSECGLRWTYSTGYIRADMMDTHVRFVRSTWSLEGGISSGGNAVVRR